MNAEAKKKQDRLVHECLTMLRSASPQELLEIMEWSRGCLLEAVKQEHCDRLLVAAGFAAIPHYLDEDYNLAGFSAEERVSTEERLECIDNEISALRHKIGVVDSVCRLLDFSIMRGSVDDIIAAMRPKEGSIK